MVNLLWDKLTSARYGPEMNCGIEFSFDSRRFIDKSRTLRLLFISGIFLILFCDKFKYSMPEKVENDSSSFPLKSTFLHFSGFSVWLASLSACGGSTNGFVSIDSI